MFLEFQRPTNWMVTILVILVAAVSSVAEGADPVVSPAVSKSAEVTTPRADEMDLDHLKSKRSAAEESQDLSEPLKKTVLGLLDQAIHFWEAADELNRKAAEKAQKLNSAPDRLKVIQNELKLPIPAPDSVQTEASRMETQELEQRLRQEEAELAKAKTVLGEWTAQLDIEKNQPQKLREDIVRAKQRLDEIREELKAPALPDEPPPVTEAGRISLLAEQAKRQAEIKSYEQHLLGHDVLLSLLTGEVDLSSRGVAWRDALTKAWLGEAQRRRQEEAMEARKEAEEAKQQSLALPPPIREQFDINLERGEELEKLTRQDAALTRKFERKQAELKELEEEFALARERVETAVLTEAIGMALREQRESLPRLSGYRRDSAKRQLRMSEIREAQFDADLKRRDLADIEAETDRVIHSLGSLPETEVSEMRSQVQKLLNDRRDLLEKLRVGYRRHFKNLENLEFAEQQIVTRARGYAEFLDRHLLWIRSTKTIGRIGLGNLSAAVVWVTNSAQWRQIILDTGSSIRRGPALWAFGVLVGLVLIAGRGWARQDVVRIAKKASQVQKDSFGLTIRALMVTALLAVGWPFWMVFIGGRLLALPMANDFSRAAGSGLVAASLLLATIGFFYHMCRHNGLAQVHFKWSEAARLTVRRHLIWFLSLVVPLSFLISAIEAEGHIANRDSIGRLAFIGAMVGVAVFAAWVLRFSGPVVSMLVKRHPSGWLVRLRHIWYSLAVGLPIVLAILDVMGYYYTALALEARVEATVGLVLGLILANTLLLRWLSLTRRRLALDEARRKREEARVQKREKHNGDVCIEDQPIVIEEPGFGLARIDEQTRGLLRTVILFSALLGLWAIWSSVLPALNVLKNVHLWSYTVELDGVTKTLPITLADLAMAIVVVAITIMAARNLPGIMQITVLNRLSMDRGVRYAFSTISRYAITAIGIIVVFRTIGIRWASLQWLIAALGVGLGFGLQEIVANFVCGLIVLFERPYRVGDVVTVGDTSGVVTRISMRATTITNWDRHELIVPNKDFITGKLINWSLSDPIMRVVIPVGIVYGSDTARAERLLLKVARENSFVLDQPEPSALFLGFGDNSLNFELRVFISGVEKMFFIKHQLHQAIDQEFRKAGITIAFPQRDIHLDTIGPLEVRVVSGRKASQPPPSKSRSPDEGPH